MTLTILHIDASARRENSVTFVTADALASDPESTLASASGKTSGLAA